MLDEYWRHAIICEVGLSFWGLHFFAFILYFRLLWFIYWPVFGVRVLVSDLLFFQLKRRHHQDRPHNKSRSRSGSASGEHERSRARSGSGSGGSGGVSSATSPRHHSRSG